MIKLNQNSYCKAYLGGVEYCKGYFAGNLIFGCDNAAPVGNLPPTIGDLDIFVDGGVQTEITYEDFVLRAKPPYNDPEGDLMDAVKVDFIEPTNKGYFIINGALAKQGDIITRENFLDSNYKLIHIGQSVDDFADDILLFSVRDAVNGNWVS